MDRSLRNFATRVGGETLTDLDKPPSQDWKQFTVTVLEQALRDQQPVFFDLTHVADIAAVLDNTGNHARTVTGHELRYLKTHWHRFRTIVHFYENDEERTEPW